MIGYIEGKIIDIDMTQAVVLTTGGVWYCVLINEIIYSQIALEQNVNFHIYHHKTENSESLFGFLDKTDKQVFTELIKISGVWGKVAMLILSLWVDKLIAAVQWWDNKTIESIKWIGKKMAEKIILELKDKDFIMQADIVTQTEHKAQVSLPRDIAEDIKNTLVNMGYTPKDVDNVLAKLPENMEDIGSILPYCIRELS